MPVERVDEASCTRPRPLDVPLTLSTRAEQGTGKYSSLLANGAVITLSAFSFVQFCCRCRVFANPKPTNGIGHTGWTKGSLLVRPNRQYHLGRCQSGTVYPICHQKLGRNGTTAGDQTVTTHSLPPTHNCTICLYINH